MAQRERGQSFLDEINEFHELDKRSRLNAKDLDGIIDKLQRKLNSKSKKPNVSKQDKKDRMYELIQDRFNNIVSRMSHEEAVKNKKKIIDQVDGYAIQLDKQFNIEAPGYSVMTRMLNKAISNVKTFQQLTPVPPDSSREQSKDIPKKEESKNETSVIVNPSAFSPSKGESMKEALKEPDNGDDTMSENNDLDTLEQELIPTGFAEQGTFEHYNPPSPRQEEKKEEKANPPVQKKGGRLNQLQKRQMLRDVGFFNQIRGYSVNRPLSSSFFNPKHSKNSIMTRRILRKGLYYKPTATQSPFVRVKQNVSAIKRGIRIAQGISKTNKMGQLDRRLARNDLSTINRANKQEYYALERLAKIGAK